jgi:magnesium transporter
MRRGSVLDRLRCATKTAKSATNLSKNHARDPAAETPFLREVVAELHEADLGDLIAALEPDDRVKLVELTGADFDFSALNEVDDTVREEILEELEPETVAEGVRELESDDAVELLEGLDEEDKEEILEKLPPSERVALERSLLYPENSAGRRMQTEFIAVPPDWTVGQAIDYMRDTPDLPDRFYEIYAVDARSTGRARYRSTRCCARAGRCRWPI